MDNLQGIIHKLDDVKSNTVTNKRKNTVTVKKDDMNWMYDIIEQMSTIINTIKRCVNHGQIDSNVLTDVSDNVGLTVDTKYGLIETNTTHNNDGVWVSVDGERLAHVGYDEHLDELVIRAWNQNNNTGDYEYLQKINNSNNKDLNQIRLKELIERKNKELNVTMIGVEISKNGDAHILCQSNDVHTETPYIVWTSPISSEIDTSYVSYYDGSYDLSLNEAYKEIDLRKNK